MPSRRRRYRARPKLQVKRPPANEEIRAPQVRLIDADGSQLGVISTPEALEKAIAAELDLVVVAEKADPPVARIMDVGKHMYEQRKKQAKQKAKSKGGEIKGIRIGFKIGAHDQEIRLRKADEFLNQGHKVKVEMRLRGREKGRGDMARQKIRDFVAAIPGNPQIEGGISYNQGSISALVVRPRA
ncbi:MAG: translation initiation factor IF-3 [Candidatus Andersenbacteria bacterium]|nr:translation initiation factor IF-3 [bacterium]MDZ4225251.1 translation initiation factor IF-3 [Candidatus Andersenbacteria bacterium]